MNANDASTSLGKYFSWLAWLIAIALLIFVFQDYLDRQWNPNQQPELRLSSSGRAEVILQQNRQGHYLSQGTINELPVTFLLDTGATQVSIPARIAQQLMLSSHGQTSVQTANGSIKVYQTTLAQLSIGNIFLYNVPANINPAMQGNEILLGMSALKRIQFQQTGQQLILREQ
jgi:aspartyl protease family protein